MDYPKIAIVGMAGAVLNNTIFAVNIRHWGTTDGNKLKDEFKLHSFLFINDFTAAGYGVSTLHHKDVTILGHSEAE